MGGDSSGVNIVMSEYSFLFGRWWGGVGAGGDRYASE